MEDADSRQAATTLHGAPTEAQALGANTTADSMLRAEVRMMTRDDEVKPASVRGRKMEPR